MYRFFEKKYYKVRDSFRYHVTKDDLSLLQEIADEINYIRESDPATGHTKRQNAANIKFLKDLEGSFYAAFLQYDAEEGGPFYRLYREKISSKKNSFQYSGERKEKQWYIQRHDEKGVFPDMSKDVELDNVSGIFEDLLRPILNGKHFLAKSSRSAHVLDSLKRTKLHVEEGMRWLVSHTDYSRKGYESVDGMTDTSSSERMIGTIQ